MADFYTQATMQPDLPQDLGTDELTGFLSHFGFSPEYNQDTVYFYAEEYLSTCFPIVNGKEVDLTEEDLIKKLQQVIKNSGGRLQYIYIQAATTCSKMRPDSFGGWVLFVTANRFCSMNTLDYIFKKIDKMKKR